MYKIGDKRVPVFYSGMLSGLLTEKVVYVYLRQSKEYLKMTFILSSLAKALKNPIIEISYSKGR